MFFPRMRNVHEHDGEPPGGGGGSMNCSGIFLFVSVFGSGNLYLLVRKHHSWEGNCEVNIIKHCLTIKNAVLATEDPDWLVCLW